MLGRRNDDNRALEMQISEVDNSCTAKAAAGCEHILPASSFEDHIIVTAQGHSPSRACNYLAGAQQGMWQ